MTATPGAYAAHLGWGPLRDLRIVEFGHFVAGPYATLQLAYYGAEVIKVESTSRPDMWRLREGESDIHASVPFADHNKNKLSVTLDLKDPACQDVVRDLVARSDAVVENFSYGVLERLGLGYEALARRRPDLVMLSLQGFGREGPLRDAVALGPSLMAHSGMTVLWSPDGARAPVGSQTSYPDYVVGLQAAFALLCALRHRDLTGEGQHLELAQIDAVLGLVAADLAAADAQDRGVPEAPSPSAVAGVYPCAGEDRWCAIEVRTAAEWQGLLRAVPTLRPVVRRRPSAPSEATAAAIDLVLREWTAQRTPQEAMADLQACGVPAGAVLDGRDLVEDPHLRSRGFAIPTGHPVLGDVLLPGPVARHAGDGPRVTRYAPLLGEDRDDVLSRVLDLTPEQIKALRP